MNDEPRGLDGLTQIMIRQWFGRDNPDLRARLNDPTFLVDLRQQAEDAEYLLMLALGFDFNVDLLIPTCARLVARVDALKMLRGNFHFQQFMVAACNDIMQRDPMLVLQYPSSSIAAGVIQLYFKLARQQKLKLEQPPSAGDGEHPWYVSEGVSVETHAEIEGRFLANVYVQVENKGGKDAAAGSQNSAPTTTTTTFDGTNSHGGLGTMLNSQDITRKSNLKVPMDHERERERTRHEPCDWLNPKYSGGDGVTGGLSISQVHGPNNRYETAIRNAPPPPVTQEDSDLEEGEIR